MRALLLLSAILPACAGGAVKDDSDVETDGCPVAVVTPAAVDWTDLVLGATATDTLSIVNNCSGEGALSVIPSLSGDSAFGLADTPLSLDPGGVAIEGLVQQAPRPLHIAREEAVDALAVDGGNFATAPIGPVALRLRSAAASGIR